MAPQGGDPIGDRTRFRVYRGARLGVQIDAAPITWRNAEAAPERATKMRHADKTMVERKFTNTRVPARAGAEDGAAAVEPPTQDIGGNPAFVLEQAIERCPRNVE